MRDPIDVLRALNIAGAIAFGVAGNFEAALRLAVTGGVMILARVINVPRPFDLGFVIGMALQGWGNAAGLFDRYDWYDSVVHFTLSAMVAPLFYIGLARLEVVPDLQEDFDEHHNVGIFLISLALGTAFGAVYEIYEYVAVNGFGADLHIGYGDTILDMTLDVLGSALGGAGLMAWAQYGWGTSRRVPPERLERAQRESRHDSSTSRQWPGNEMSSNGSSSDENQRSSLTSALPASGAGSPTGSKT
jgi:hypothetical protein